MVADWSQGPATAALTQSGTCTDSAPGGVMFVNLVPRHGQLTGFASAASWRTRCPGPMVTAQGNPLLEAALPRTALGQRTFTIGLRPAGSVQDDGYTLAVRGRLSLVVSRGAITQQVITEPAG